MSGHDTSWIEDAACSPKRRHEHGLETNDFFPGAGGKPFGRKAELIKATCAGCPVRHSCDTYAEQTSSTGIWAGRLRQVSYRTPTAEGVITNKTTPN